MFFHCEIHVFALNYWWSPHLSLFQLADIIILDLSLRTFNRKPLYCLLLNGWFRKRTRWANSVFWLATQAGNMHGARTLLARISHYGAARKSSRRNIKKKTCNELQTTKEKEREISPTSPNLNSLSVPKSVRFSGLENGNFLFNYSHPFSLSLSSNSFTLSFSICAR